MKLCSFPAIAGLVLGTLVAPAAVAQQIVASYQFEDLTLSSSHTTPNMASDLDLSLPHVFWFEPTQQETMLCFGDEWNAGGTMTFTVTPAPGKPLDLTSFEWTSWKDVQTSPVSVNSAMVFVDGQQVATINPLVPIQFNKIDLSGIASLQGVEQPVTFSVDFGGSNGHTSYEIRSVIVNAKACVENLPDNDRTFFMKIDGFERRWRSLDGMSMTEFGDGTARMQGAIENLADPCLRFTVDLLFSDRLDRLDTNFPPAGSPFTGPIIDPLVASGEVRTEDWHYYETVTGSLTGRRCLQGAVIDVQRTGPAFQVGTGANFFDTLYGASGGFLMTTTSQPDDPNFTINSMFVAVANVAFGADCDCFGGEVAQSNVYGTGLAGCGGVPAISANDPLTGTDFVINVGNTTMMPTSGVLAWSLFPAQVAVPFLGGNLLVDPVFLTIPITAAPGTGANFTLTIPDSACFLTKEYYVQAIMIDSCAPAGFALSQGLEMLVGDL